VVGAVQHTKIFPLPVLAACCLQRAFSAQTLDACHHALGLVLFAVTVHDAHRLALAQFAEQRFRKELGVRADDIVGGPQDGAGRAVVLLQLHHLQVRKVLRQFFQVVQRRAAPAVDRLVVIAHGGQPAPRAHQQLQHFVLRGVGVLVFIDQHMTQRSLPLAAYRFMVLQQLQRHADQIVKVHALIGAQALFVARHDACNDFFFIAAGLRFGLRRVQPAIFPAADGPLPLPRGGRVGAAARVFQNAGDVVGVQNRKLRFQPQRYTVLAQHPHTKCVKGADHHALGLFANQRFGALAHLGGRLVGKGDCRDLLGLQP